MVLVETRDDDVEDETVNVFPVPAGWWDER